MGREWVAGLRPDPLWGMGCGKGEGQGKRTERKGKGKSCGPQHLNAIHAPALYVPTTPKIF